MALVAFLGRLVLGRHLLRPGNVIVDGLLPCNVDKDGDDGVDGYYLEEWGRGTVVETVR